MSIAEDYYTGACCSHCAEYFDHTVGVPALCADCYQHASKQEKQMYTMVLD